jgi:hypothetical protein
VLVYEREINGRRTRVTPTMIRRAGEMGLTASRAYRCWDNAPANGTGVCYWLEEIGVNGNRTLHGPVAPVSSR